MLKMTQQEKIQPSDHTLQPVDTDPMVSLLAAGGIDAELIWEGSESDCPWYPHDHDEGVLSAA